MADKIERSEIIETIKSTPFFETLKADEEALGEIADGLTIWHFEETAILVMEGDVGDSLYVIHKGSVRILKTTLAGEEYTVVTLSHNEHACIGELSLFDTERRSATVVAEVPTDVLIMKKEIFDKFADRYPRHALNIFRKLAGVMSTRLRKANDDIITLFEALVSEIEQDVVADETT
ncbi:MAG: cyclic nucleotide-binding domain-containing protein [Candidatus Lindowbacteria bacterium]|nr:cyclic nucleotide-binding domain-containing protein [Candidatus Lindowbacteria bacterium]